MKKIFKWYLKLDTNFQSLFINLLIIVPTLCMFAENAKDNLFLVSLILYATIALSIIIGRFSQREKQKGEMCRGCAIKENKEYAPVEVKKVFWDLEEDYE